MSVKGARELGGDLGTVDRLGEDAEIVAQHGNVEPPEVKQLGDRGVGDQRLEARRVVSAAGELHQMRPAVAAGELDQAKPVARHV